MPVVQVCVFPLCRWHGVCYVHQSLHLMTLLPLLLNRLHSKWPPAERGEKRDRFNAHSDTYQTWIKAEHKNKCVHHTHLCHSLVAFRRGSWAKLLCGLLQL